MEPDGCTIDDYVMLLDWHSRCFIVLCEVEAGLKNIIVDGESNLRPSAVIFKNINDIIEENLNLLLVEGFDVLTFNDLALTKIMDICSIQQGSFQVQATKISTDYLAQESGKAILGKITQYCSNHGEINTFSICKLLLWRVAAQRILKRTTGNENGAQRPTLDDAKCLLQALPASSICQNTLIFDQHVGTNAITSAIRLTQYLPLHELVIKSERINKDGFHALNQCKEWIHDVFADEEKILKLFLLMKSLRTQLKSMVEHGLKLDTSLEKGIDQRIKDLNYVKKLFDYPILHSKVNQELNRSPLKSNDMVFDRVPWDVLVNLNEKIPLSFDAKRINNAVGLDLQMIQVCLKLKDMFENAKRWQGEITRVIPALLGGRKRRALGHSSKINHSSKSLVSVQQIEELLDCEILEKVKISFNMIIIHFQ